MHSNKDGHILSTPGAAPMQQTRFLGPAQRRYSDYFLSVLSSPELQQPEGLTKVLRQIVFSPFLPPEEDGKLFLVVYQHGNSIWAGPPSSEVGCTSNRVVKMLRTGTSLMQDGSAACRPAFSLRLTSGVEPLQGGLIPFEIGVSVVGDVTIAVWLGSHNMGERIHSRPSFAYAFHTGCAAAQPDVTQEPSNVTNGLPLLVAFKLSRL